MNSSHIYEALGNTKKKEIPQSELKLQHKLINTDLNYTPSKPGISRDLTTKELNNKFFNNRENLSSKNSNNLNPRNKLLESKKLSKSIDKNSSNSSKNIFNLTYQDKPKVSKNGNSINNLSQKGTIEGYKQKHKKSKKIWKEKLIPVALTERNETAKNQNKNEINFVGKTKKRTKSYRKIKPEVINNIDSKKRINELEEENKKLKEEINKMKKQLNDKDEIIKNQELKIKEHENTIENARINNNKELEKLMDEIKKIKSIIPFEILPEEKIMAIIFQSDDQNILHSVLCKNTDQFKRIKDIIYDKYPEYKENENYFLFNGKKINENETLEENKIIDGSIITIFCHYN